MPPNISESVVHKLITTSKKPTMTNQKITPHCPIFAKCLAISLMLTPLMLSAQETKEEIINLDEFKVSTTVGSYEERSTSAGTKIPMDLKDLAGTLQVLNASFIGDKRAQSLEDLYPYIVGMTRESPAAAAFTLRRFTNHSTNTLINNLQTDGLPGGASRFGSPTTANVERVEVLKGPSSVLYGSMNPGGMINIVTKQPGVKAAYSLTGTFSDY